jgi:hypothetical protein
MRRAVVDDAQLAYLEAGPASGEPIVLLTEERPEAVTAALGALLER